MVEWVDGHANGNDMYCDTTLFFFLLDGASDLRTIPDVNS